MDIIVVLFVNNVVCFLNEKLVHGLVDNYTNLLTRAIEDIASDVDIFSSLETHSWSVRNMLATVINYYFNNRYYEILSLFAKFRQISFKKF